MAKNILDAISNTDDTTPMSGYIEIETRENDAHKNESTVEIFSNKLSVDKIEATAVVLEIEKKIDDSNIKVNKSPEPVQEKQEDIIPSITPEDLRSEDRKDKSRSTKFVISKTDEPIRVEKRERRKKISEPKNIEITPAPEPLWLSVSEAAKTGGVEQKTIRRAIQSESVKFKIINNRYLLEFASLVKYLSSNTKLRNKFLSHGIGQYVDKWK